ncbi:MAG: GTPase ObgE [Candidatus Marinimicrobia bacterium]|nr:GTPase ObgE [Candidatus Neomarinimicrobiota bacterium]|tara:strand:- start:922 stop:1881 length:960 start_codon:yes stop_codon:yes gene_type:complete
MFIDYAQIELKAGNGGAGAVSFHREKFHPKGGPDGGEGGRGGHIVFKASRNLHTLQDIKFKKKYKAQNGSNGKGSNKTGKNGSDLIVSVPIGTLVKKKDRKEIVADLIKDGQEFIICNGGIGGKGNSYYKTSTNQSPQKSQPGISGEKGVFDIELKVLADVGLVGLPNAGKSTLLASLSSARPKIADYPFTTLSPNLGIVKYGEYGSFVMADIPGLIEGASRGKGLGHQFLRHIERNKILIFLIDSLEENPYNTLSTLEKELVDFNPDIMIKPKIICKTKSDLIIEQTSEWAKIDNVISISSVTGEGISSLIKEITRLL